MTPERWRQVEEIFHAALSRVEGERRAFLVQTCAGDLGLHREVESLLAQQASAAGFLDGPAVAASAQRVSDAGASVVTGRRLGAYQVHERIGAGGMGEVYRARDTKLGRDVAIKVLPSLFTSDPDRMARFEREARVLASLNHPHIGAIYGLEDADGQLALVLELVGGETLADRIARGPIHLNDTLTIAGQMADALEAAHEKGIIHRDLKPANIKVTSDGVVKVLDFGLARIVSTGEGSTADSRHPTITIDGTREGLVIGTPAYMSPEQARGQTVDKRTDIWAFGCVLYEMLTARPAFAGDTVSDTVAAVLQREPDWSLLPAATPAFVQRLLRRCLHKDAKRRLHDISDARIELEDAFTLTGAEKLTERATNRHRRFIWIAAAGALLATGIAVPLWRLRAPGNATPVTTGPMTRLTWDSGLTTDPSISVDGRLIAYASDRSGEGNLDIWIQQTSGGSPIQLTADPTDDHEPDVSPDGSLVAFRSERKGGGVYVVSALGGDARLIVPLGSGPKFSPDGRSIAFWTGRWIAARGVQTRRQTYVIPTAGGETVQVVSELASAGDPVWSPNGNELLIFGRRAISGADSEADWWWVPLDGRAATKSGAYDRMRAVGILTPPPAGSEYPYPQAWTEEGVLFTATVGSGDARNIWTLAIDRRSGLAVGDPRQVTMGPVRVASPAASRDGRLVFSDIVERSRLLGLPLEATSGRAAGIPKPLRTDAARVGTRASASQDGRLLVFGILGFSGSEVWLRDLQTSRERQLAAIPLASLNPLISRTGQFVAYTAITEERGASGGLGAGYVMDAQNGAPRKICDTCEVFAFADDRHVLINTEEPGRTWLLDVETRERVLVAADAQDLRLSWDAHWGAFFQGDTLYVAPFRFGEMKRQEWVPITKRLTNSERPTGWSPDSTILYFLLERDGFRCLYAIRIDPEKGHPQGEVFPVYHFHDTRFRWGSTTRASAIVTGLFISGQYEQAGNVWMTNLIRRK